MIAFDCQTRSIQLDGATTVSLREVYSRWVDWAASGSNLGCLPAFSSVAQPPKVPVYLTLENGWKIKPQAGSYILVISDGFLYSDGDPFIASGGVEPRIRFDNPVIAVGYDSGAVVAGIPAAVWNYAQ